MVIRGGEVGEVERCWSKDTELQVCRMNKFRNLMDSMMTVVNNTILNT